MINGNRKLFADDKGSVVIETAFVVPILALLALGAFDTSRLVARHMEIQAAVGEAESVVLANPPSDADERGILEDVIEASTGLEDSKVTLTSRFRCNADADLVDTSTSCSSTDIISEFVEIQMTDRVSPMWTAFGVGGPIDFNVTKRVQVS